MDLNKLQDYYDKNFGEPKEVELITPLFPKGKTLVYGVSSSGKTYSTIKHLNRNNIKPLLIDFDNNKLVDGIDMYFFKGDEFINGFNSIFTVKRSSEEDELQKGIQKAFKSIMSNQDIGAFTRSELNNEYSLVVGYEKQIEFLSEHINKSQREELEDLILDYENRTSSVVTIVNKDSIHYVENQVIIIDTFVKAMKHFNSVEDFERFVNRLLKLGNSVIIIAHTKRFMNSEVPDVDEEFGNHCDGRLMLNKSNLKSRPNEYWLVIEKLRGYKGEDKIFNWEREG